MNFVDPSGDAWTAAELAYAAAGGPADDQPIDRELANWQGRIANAAKDGCGLDVYQAALNWAKQTVPSENGLLEKAKQEIRDAAERHLLKVYCAEVRGAIYFSTFPEDATQSNAELDAAILSSDRSNEADVEIARLAKLSTIEYEHQRKASAEKLGIDRIAVLDAAVKVARSENGDTKGQGRPLELPTIEPWPDPVDGADLLDNICNAVKRYLVLPEGSAEILALWAMHTHAFECFAHSPRLAITSPEKQCGKTTTLDVLGELVGRPLPTSNATTAAIFRTIEKAKPTLLIDEADTFLGENEELRGVLNSGHRRGGQILRTVGDDQEPRQFATWAPAAIAMIGRLPDTLEDRSVSIALRRRRPTEKVQQFRSDRVQDLKQLARKIARWCDDNHQTLAASDANTGMLVNRSADNWRPLFAIADIAGGRWPERARAVAEAAETAKQDQSKRTMVLGDIRDIFAARPEADRVSSAELTNALGAMENRPWSEWRNGKPMTPTALAWLLAPFGIMPGTKRDGDSTFKGYLRSDFTQLLGPPATA
jgi:putative DNA primase/helicase